MENYSPSIAILNSTSMSMLLVTFPSNSLCELVEQYRHHLARPVEQIEIAFLSTTSTNLHIFPFYAGASRLPPRLLAAGAKPCGAKKAHLSLCVTFTICTLPGYRNQILRRSNCTFIQGNEFVFCSRALTTFPSMPNLCNV